MSLNLAGRRLTAAGRRVGLDARDLARIRSARSGACLLVAMLLAASAGGNSFAGGPRAVNGLGQPMKWNLGPIVYRPDQGNLGQLDNSDARALLSDAFNQWTVSGLAFSQGALLPFDVNASGTAGTNPAHYQNFYRVAGDGIAPVIFDSDGSIIDAMLGVGARFDVLGIAGLDTPIGAATQITEASIIINGAFFDGLGLPASPPDTTLTGLKAAIVHEIGHFINLDHSVLNHEQALNGNAGDDIYVPTMFPVAVTDEEALASLNPDDILAAKNLYTPSGPQFQGSVTAAGIPFQGANVVLRRTSDPLMTAYSFISGGLFFPCNPASPCDPCHTACNPGHPAAEGAFSAYSFADGQYRACIEPIDTRFSVAAGAGVGPLATPPIMPGPEECYDADEGSGASDNPNAEVPFYTDSPPPSIDIVLNDLPLTDPYEPNNSLGTGTTIINLSDGEEWVGALLSAADLDVYNVPVVTGQRVRIDIDAREFGSGLDAVIGFFNASNTLIASSDDSVDPDSGVFSVDPSLEVIANFTGTAKLVVSSYPDSSFTGSGGATSGPYWIRLEIDTDTDGDGAPNGEDICPNSAHDDPDRDGICSDVDDCPDRANPLPAPPLKVNGTMPAGADVSSFAISPDGTRIVYLANQSSPGVMELYSAPLGGGLPVKLNGTLAPGGQVFDYAITPDSAYVIYRASQDDSSKIELYEAYIAGGSFKLSGTLQTGGNVEDFQVSPNGGFVVFRADVEGDDALDLLSVPIAGGTTLLLQDLSAPGTTFSYGISPDSLRVAFVADPNVTGRFELFSTTIFGGVPVLLSNPGSASRDVSEFAISSSGARVVYLQDKDFTPGAYELFSVPIAGGAVVKLNGPLVTGGIVDSFAIASNGSFVVYRADQFTPGMDELFSVPIGGGGATRLNVSPAAGAGVTTYAIAPDSSRVVFLADAEPAEGAFDLFSVPLTGGTPALLRTMGSWPLSYIPSLAISPDSSWVTFTANLIHLDNFDLFGTPITTFNPNGAPTYQTPLPLQGNVYYFRISPDSSTVAFVADKDVDDRLEVYSVPIRGGEATRINGGLTPGGQVSVGSPGPAFSPDSTQIIYRADAQVAGSVDLYSVDAYLIDDADRDGIFNGCDICPLNADPNQDDADGNGQGDACAVCPIGTDPDADTICGAADNCPTVANSGQTDNDADGAGDACDADDDNDGLSDAVETYFANGSNCIFTNAGNTGTDPMDPDTDNDGIPDGQEVAAGTNPCVSGGTGTPRVSWDSHDIAVTHDPSSLFAADLDRDGDIDALLASRNSIKWYENDGASPAGWTERTVSLAGGSPTSVFAADMDGDGDLDALATWPDSLEIRWYRNEGGTPLAWTTYSIINNIIGPLSVVAGDIDGDGDMDAVSASYGGNTVAWHENDGAALPGWTTHTISTASAYPSIVSTADVDGDGDIDVLSLSRTSATIVWFENDGASPSEWTTHTITTTVTANTVGTADLDGDGDMDVLSTSGGDSNWYENNGASPPGWTTRTLSTIPDLQALFVADMDGDGDSDVLSAGSGTDPIAWHENDGASPPGWTLRTIATNPAPLTARAVVAADFDHDGDQDVLSTRVDVDSDGTLGWFENRMVHKAPAFLAPTDVATGLHNPFAFAFADIDRDGNLDIVSISPNDGKIQWHENDGESPPGWTTRPITPTVIGAEMVAAVDLDGDGDPDIETISYDNNEVLWYENTGGTPVVWIRHVIPSTGIGPWSMIVADLNRDGRPDVITSQFGDSKIFWYENLGGAPLTWSEHTLTNTLNFKRGLAAADFDGDGDLDVTSADVNAGLIYWFENPGGAATSLWTAHAMDPAGLSTPNRVAVGDVDGDGDMDVVATAYAGSEIAWFENTPAHTFPKHPIPVGQTGNFGIVVADLDGDGDNDLIATAVTAVDKISWFESDGATPPGWTERVVYVDPSNPNAPNTAQAADVDSDGDLDLVAGMGLGVGFRRIWLYENLGGQMSLTPTSLAGASTADGVTLPLFSIVAKSNGRAGDDPIELSSLEMQIADGAGLALSTDKANSLIDRVRIYLDNGSGSFELGSDTLVQTIDNLLMGPLSIRFAPGDPRMRLAPGQSRRYFIVASLATDASSHSPNAFRATLNSLSSGRDLVTGAPLQMASHLPISTPVVTIGSDVTAPVVTGVFPAPAAVDVSPGTDVILFFSEPIDPASAAVGVSLAPTGGIKVAAAVAVSTDGRVVTLNPESPLALGGSFTVRVTASLKDRAGRSAVPFTSTFLTTSDPEAGQIDAGTLGDDPGGRTLQGANADDGSGFSTAALRDVNGTGGGIDDLIIGAPNADEGAIVDAGKATLVFGAVGLQSNLAAVTSLTYHTGTAGDFIGETVARAGDANHDGIQDFLIGAPHSDQAGTDAGVVYLVFGDTGLDEAAPGPLDLDNLGACASPTLCGVRFLGQAPGDLAGAAISYAGDVNADGFDDILIGAPGADPGGRADAGKAYLIFGPFATGTIPLSAVGTTWPGLVFLGESVGDHAGASLSSWLDTQADGIDDLLLGAPGADSLNEAGATITNAGYVYAIQGGSANLDDLGVIELSRVADHQSDQVAGMVFIGTVSGGELGRSVSGAADINGDGILDVLIAANGEAYAISGDDPKTVVGSTRTGGGTPTTSQPLLRTLAGFDAIRDFGAVRYDAGNTDPLTIGLAGDLNADGYDDFIIGDPLADRADFGSSDNAGKAYIILGSPAPADKDVELSDVGDTVAGFTVEGAEQGDQLGASVGGGLDVNADGIDDGLVGAPFADSAVTAPPDAGETYIISPVHPEEVQGLTLLLTAPGTQLEWTAVDLASGYNVYRGSLGVLRLAGIAKTSNMSSLGCRVNFDADLDLRPDFLDTNPSPPPGSGYIYLVTAVNGQGEGPLGAGTPPRLNDAQCP